MTFGDFVVQDHDVVTRILTVFLLLRKASASSQNSNNLKKKERSNTGIGAVCTCSISQTNVYQKHLLSKIAHISSE